MNLADKTIINILAKSGEAVLLLISSIVMVRYLNKEEYGTFLQIMLIMNTAVMFAYFGIPQSIFYFIHKTNNKVSFVYRNIILAIILGGGAALAVFFLSEYFSRWLNNQLLYEYRYVAVTLVFLRGSIIMRDPLLISQGNLILNSVTSILSNILFYVPIITAAVFSLGLTMIFHILLVASVIDFLCFLVLIGWFVRDIAEEDNSASENNRHVGLLEQIRYAFPIGISSYIGIIGRQIDQYIISVFFSPQSFAVYSRGAMRVPVLSTIQYTVNDIMMAYYVKDYHDGNIESLLKRFHLCVEKVAKINFPVFVFLFLASPSLISLLYTDQYLGAVPIFRAYLFLLIINITTFGIIPRATGQTKSIFYASLINVLANIVLSWWLVPMLGAVGAAIATILCAFVSGYYYLFMSCRILEIGMGRIFPWRFLAHYFGVSLIAGLPIVVINSIGGMTEVPTLLILCLEGAVYCFGVVFWTMRLNLLTDDDLDTLSSWLRIDAGRLFRKVAFL